MIICYTCKNGRLEPNDVIEASDLDQFRPVWIDLVAPKSEEIEAIEAKYAITLPTPDEMREIEASSRLYQDGPAHIMTTSVVYRIESPDPQTGEITFALLRDVLITVRFAVPQAFQIYANRAQSGDIGCADPIAVTVGLIDAIIEREADLIEKLQHRIEILSKSTFDMKRHNYTREKRHAITLKEIGNIGVIASRVRDSLVSVGRMLTYFHNFAREIKTDKINYQHIKTAQQDVQSLSTYVDHISSRLSFLMDATVGLIGIEQNQIIKLFSVAAVMLMPPTLIASVYGMNFKHMPELEYTWAYPAALIAMVVSALVPFIYFKHKGWF